MELRNASMPKRARPRPPDGGGGLSSEQSHHSPRLYHHIISNAQLHDSLTKFWELEEVPESCNETLTVEEAECEAHFLSTHSRDTSGRYIVRLPFKSSYQKRGESRHIAQRCLNRLLKRLSQDPELQGQYTAFLNEYEALGHMTRVSATSPEPSHVYYLPHHCVVREDSETTKLRVVFNGSSKTSSASSLNDHLHIGPSLQSKICDGLSAHSLDRERSHCGLSTRHRHIWHSTSTISCWPSSQTTSHRRRVSISTSSGTLSKGSYVDDIGGGADNLSDLNDIANNVEALCNLGCFSLAKWKSNHPQFSKISSSLSPEDSHSFSDHISKILGLSWNCQEDVLTFTGKTSQTLSITKRTITSEAAQLFDPLGLISPVIVKAKIMIQDLWLQKDDWDDAPSPELVHRWKTFRDELS
ncbi:uncharacterized protein LOC130667151 [Microplitis mediator]|uniref:uncharacterized protein LOC130667151 n=1 Tax=Microplitis mediator TaxID=375433 RepID=UPI0025579DB5|nr:uncharacterized protein LOC130667151 [Microplitis mediator]